MTASNDKSKVMHFGHCSQRSRAAAAALQIALCNNHSRLRKAGGQRKEQVFATEASPPVPSRMAPFTFIFRRCAR